MVRLKSKNKEITVRVHYGDKDINQCCEDILPMLIEYINKKAGRKLAKIRDVPNVDKNAKLTENNDSNLINVSGDSIEKGGIIRKGKFGTARRVSNTPNNTA